MKLISLNAALLLGSGFFIPAWDNALAGKLEEPFHRTVALATKGTVRLQNISGSVHVSTWDRPEIEIKAIKRASRQSDLDAVAIEVEAKPDRVAIESKYPKFRWGRGTASTTVDYEIKVPSGVNLRDLVTVNGEIRVEGVAGSIRANTIDGQIRLKGAGSNTRLETINGSIDAAFDRFDAVERLSAKTINGRIHLTLPAGANAEVSVNTLNGSITGPAGLDVKHHLVGSDIRGRLGKGGGTIRAETINGSIQLDCEGVQKTRNSSATPAEQAEEQ